MTVILKRTLNDGIIFDPDILTFEGDLQLRRAFPKFLMDVSTVNLPNFNHG